MCGFGGLHFHSTGPGQSFSSSSIKWSAIHNYAPEIGNAVGGGLAFIRNNSSTALYLSSAGNVGIGTTSPSQKLNVIWNILASGTVTGSSDRNVKEHFSSVIAREVSAKVSALPITEWNYIADRGTSTIGQSHNSSVLKSSLSTAARTLCSLPSTTAPIEAEL